MGDSPEEGAYAMGIDLGTTSVKLALVHRSTGKLVTSKSAETKANIYDEEGMKFEQSVSKIFTTVNQLLNELPRELKAKVNFIGVSGQMHGVVMWKRNSWCWQNGDRAFRVLTSHTDTLGAAAVTNLITWQDQRCSPEFLASLPDPCNNDKLNTGFGLPTLIWMQRNEPMKFQSYNYCGTIQDFLVAILTENNETPVMSDQNASSWGYFDDQHTTWNKAALETINFPTDILPIVKAPESLAGELKTCWSHIPEGTAVGVALGDLEASVLSILQGRYSDDAGIINISTSIQLTFIMPTGFKPSERSEEEDRVEYRPYFAGRYLAVAAGLNGGNCLAFFVSTLKNWLHQLGQELPGDRIWETLLEEGYKQKTSDLTIEPTLHGERYSSSKRASIRNMTTTNMDLGHVFRSLCSGIIDNLQDILPLTMLKRYDVRRIYATGSALIRNRVLQEEIHKQFKDFHVEACDSGDAAYGAALMASISSTPK